MQQHRIVSVRVSFILRVSVFLLFHSLAVGTLSHRRTAQTKSKWMTLVDMSSGAVHIFGCDEPCRRCEQMKFLLAACHTFSTARLCTSHAKLLLTIHLHEMPNRSIVHLKNCLRKCHRHWCVSLRPLNYRCALEFLVQVKLMMLLLPALSLVPLPLQATGSKNCARDGNQQTQTKRLNLCGETKNGYLLLSCRRRRRRRRRGRQSNDIKHVISRRNGPLHDFINKTLCIQCEIEQTAGQQQQQQQRRRRHWSARVTVCFINKILHWHVQHSCSAHVNAKWYDFGQMKFASAP